MTDLDVEPIAIISAGCELGEGSVWDHRRDLLWFTDIQNAQLLRLDWPAGTLRRHALPERLGSLALTADPDMLLCAFASGFALYRPDTGDLRWVHKVEPDYRGLRMNDGRADRQGRFWAGSMVEKPDMAPPDGGTLYRLDGGDVTPVFSDIRISNSIAFSPAGDRFYFADTPSHEICAFDLDAASGALSNRRVFARLADDAYPDGSDVDAAGWLWNAEWGPGRVTAYRPDGNVAMQIRLPVSHVTCVAFGGEALDHLFVTTAREGLSEAALAREPNAGDVFVYRVGSRGLPAPIFKGLA